MANDLPESSNSEAVSSKETVFRYTGQRLSLRDCGLNKWNLGLLGFGYLPLLLSFFLNLWGKPQYQFFPLAFAAAGFLAWTRVSETDKPFKRGTMPLTTLLLAISFSLLLLATMLWSPWVSGIAAFLGIVALFYWLGGGRLLRTMMPALVMLLIVIPPPVFFEEKITLFLRKVAVVLSSHLLDSLGVIHLLSGNIIALPRQTLMVEEACSGINSILFTSAACVFYVLWRKRSPYRLLIYLPLNLVFVLMGNIARITLGAWLNYSKGIDILKGIPHESLGLLLTTCYLGLIISLDHLLLWKQPLSRSSPLAAATSQAEAPSPSLRPVSPAFGWLAGFAFAVVGLTGIALAGIRMHESPYAGLPDTAQIKDFAFMLPKNIGPWEQLDSAPTGLHHFEGTGVYFKNWQYQAPGLVALTGVNYPFQGYHDVSVCYSARGWNIVHRYANPKEGNVHPPMEVVEMTREDGFYGVLYFGILDRRGNWLDKPGAASETFVKRCSRFAGVQPTTFQVQVLVLSDAPLTFSELEKEKAFFESSGRILAGQLIKRGATTP